LAQRLAVAAPGDALQEPPPLLLVTGIAAEPVRPWPGVVADSEQVVEDIPPAPAGDAVRHAGELLERLPDAGVVAALNASWCDLGPRPMSAAPYDRRPWLGQTGVADPAGELKPHGQVWASAARRDVDAGRPAPWPPDGLDEAQWYDNLPDASNDLFARFRTEFGVASE
jgi:hypothetical protein